jgi:dual specificity tyrosine-phosphorylation-regulated kinase 2/3/4
MNTPIPGDLLQAPSTKLPASDINVKRSQVQTLGDEHPSPISFTSLLESESKSVGPIKDENVTGSKHRRLGVGVGRTSAFHDGKRRENVGLTISTNTSNLPNRRERRVRGPREPPHHLPSRSLAAYPQSSHPPLASRNPGTKYASQTKPPFRYAVHSLLRRTQKGWSALDDEATAEALRKLDGLSGKGARARRTSVDVFGRATRSSRQGKPTPTEKYGGRFWLGS